jgi:N-acetylglucosaminyl-diphospho-decaprenol L-rhamnosyltransferase
LPAVSILIVNWNDRDHLAACLASLADVPCDIVVVDNGSADGSAAMVSRQFPRVTLIALPDNAGFARGVNLAAMQARGQYLLVLNSDTEAVGRAVLDLADFLAVHQEAAVAAGQLVGADGEPQRGWNVRRLPSLPSFAVDLLLLHKLWPGNPVSRRHQALDVGYVEPAEVEQPAGACMMVRRDVFERLQGFDERFWPAWFEDVDFCRRVRAIGGRLYFVPAAVFRHHGGVSREHLSLSGFSRIWYRNLQRYVVKHHGRWGLLVIKPLVVVGMLLRAALRLTAGDPAGARAYLSVIADTISYQQRPR